MYKRQVQGNIVNATGAGDAIELGGTSINTAGTLSNVAYLNQDNTFTAAGTALSVTNNATIGGTLAIQGSGALTLGSTSNVGKATFLDGTADGFTTSIATLTQANNVALSIPADVHSTDTVCLESLGNCAAGGGSFIENQTSLQTSANFDIEGVGSSVTAVIQGASGQDITCLLYTSRCV